MEKMSNITIKKKFPTQYLLLCNACGREGYIHKKYYDKFGWKHECSEAVKVAEKKLDELGIEYDYVSTVSKMIIVFEDGTSCPYDTFLEKHSKEVATDANDILYPPHPQTNVNNEITKADTEIIKKPSRKKR